MDLKFSTILSQVCAAILGFMGFGCSSEAPDIPDVPVMYGTPTGTFEIKGKVTDENNGVVADAVVRVTFPDVDSNLYYIDECATDISGNYIISGREIPLEQYKVVCLPNTPDLKPDSVFVNMKYELNDNDEIFNWYVGHADVIADFKLNKQK